MKAPDLPNRMTVIEITEPGGPEVLKPKSEPLPKPGADELLVRVEAAGVNRPDVIQRQGKYPMPAGVSPVPGLEVAGAVVSKGLNVDAFVVGDRICGLTNGGGYAEYCVIPAGQALPVPDGMTMVEAAALPETFFTVWANLFEIGRVQPGDIVLIHGGTSGIGTTSLMLCREFGIKAFATAGSAAKCDAIAELGAIAINYRQDDFAATVLAHSAGRGADVILDIMGASYFDRNMESLARGGRLVVIGFLGGRVAANLDLQQLALKRAVITGSTMRARSADEKAKIATELLERVWPILAQGRSRPIIHATFPLADAAKAHAMMEAGEHIGKIVLEVSRSTDIRMTVK